MLISFLDGKRPSASNTRVERYRRSLHEKNLRGLFSSCRKGHQRMSRILLPFAGVRDNGFQVILEFRRVLFTHPADLINNFVLHIILIFKASAKSTTSSLRSRIGRPWRAASRSRAASASPAAASSSTN